MVVHTDHATLIGLGTARTTVAQSLTDGAITVEGDREASARCARLFGVLVDEPGEASEQEGTRAA